MDDEKIINRVLIGYRLYGEYMIPRSARLRIARSTNQLEKIKHMYIDGLGFSLLGEFSDHDGFDGVIIGHREHHYHLEFTYHHEQVGSITLSQDSLLVFYIPDVSEWGESCVQMINAGFIEVTSYNPYWDIVGKTYEDIDGYRVVLQNREWGV